MKMTARKTRYGLRVKLSQRAKDGRVAECAREFQHDDPRDVVAAGLRGMRKAVRALIAAGLLLGLAGCIHGAPCPDPNAPVGVFSPCVQLPKCKKDCSVTMSVTTTPTKPPPTTKPAPESKP